MFMHEMLDYRGPPAKLLVVFVEPLWPMVGRPDHQRTQYNREAPPPTTIASRSRYSRGLWAFQQCKKLAAQCTCTDRSGVPNLRSVVGAANNRRRLLVFLGLKICSGNVARVQVCTGETTHFNLISEVTHD
jgi:hypothetical protein